MSVKGWMAAYLYINEYLYMPSKKPEDQENILKMKELTARAVFHGPFLFSGLWPCLNCVLEQPGPFLLSTQDLHNHSFLLVQN